MAKLTKMVVDEMVATDRDVTIWDETLPGFGVKASPGGTKSYVVQYRNAEGRTRRLTLGRHGALTPDSARKLAIKRMGEVASGRDPLAEKQATRELAMSTRPMTLGTLAEQWVEHQRAKVVKGKLRQRTFVEYARQVQTDVVPRLGRVKLADFGVGDAQRLHDELADRPTLANRVLDLLSAIWRWGEVGGYVSGPNPCRTVERNAERRRDRHLSHDELAALGEALRTLTAARKVPARVAALIRLIALTGCRPGEIKSLAWADADLGRHVLRLRDTKTGDRDVWLSEPALAVLRELPRVKDSPFVFPARRKTREPRPVGAFRKPWAALLKAAKIPPAMPYVLRHTYASESESLGNSHYLTAALLGHSLAGRDMTRGYVHHVATEVRAASERVARRIAAALDGEVIADNVVPIRG